MDWIYLRLNQYPRQIQYKLIAEDSLQKDISGSINAERQMHFKGGKNQQCGISSSGVLSQQFNVQLSAVFHLSCPPAERWRWISSRVMNQQFNVQLSAAFHLSCPPAESWTVNQQQCIESAIQCPTFSCPPAVNLCHHFHRISVQLSLFVRELMVGNCWKCWSTCHQLCHSHCTLNFFKSVQNAKSDAHPL